MTEEKKQKLTQQLQSDGFSTVEINDILSVCSDGESTCIERKKGEIKVRKNGNQQKVIEDFLRESKANSDLVLK